MTIGQVYWTVGAHDLVGFMEAPDEEILSALLLELGSAGNVRSTTMRAFDRDELNLRDGWLTRKDLSLRG